MGLKHEWKLYIDWLAGVNKQKLFTYWLMCSICVFKVCKHPVYLNTLLSLKKKC